MLRDRALAPLSQQHQNALAQCVLIDRSLQGEPPPETVARVAALVVDRYDAVVSNHFAIEEEIVFPAVERELGEQPSVHAFIQEHRQIEKIVDQLRSAPEAPALREYASLLRLHVRREEDELFEEAQQKLPRKVLDALGAEVDARAVRMPI